MAELKWSLASVSDMVAIHDYISIDSAVYARYQIENICKSVERLRQFPESGRHLPEFTSLPHREIITGSYRVIYRFETKTNEVVVVAVVHGRRLLR